MPHDTLNRLRAEFLEMPDLRLKSEQVQRLCGVERMICQLVLDSLVDEQFLCLKLDGHYARLTTGHHPPPRRQTSEPPSVPKGHRDADGTRPLVFTESAECSG
jgi:hypothetical protein